MQKSSEVGFFIENVEKQDILNDFWGTFLIQIDR